MLAVKQAVQLSKRDRILVVLFYMDYGVDDCNVNAPLPRKLPICGEKTTVMYDCIFTPAPEDSSRV